MEWCGAAGERCVRRTRRDSGLPGWIRGSRNAAMRAIMSAGEAARAARFYQDRDRNRFIVARATLRASC